MFLSENSYNQSLFQAAGFVRGCFPTSFVRGGAVFPCLYILFSLRGEALVDLVSFWDFLKLSSCLLSECNQLPYSIASLPFRAPCVSRSFLLGWKILPQERKLLPNRSPSVLAHSSSYACYNASHIRWNMNRPLRSRDLERGKGGAGC